MEDGIERSLHSLLENQEKIFEQPDENQKKEQSKILYLCYPDSDEFNLIKCIITDKKEIVRNLTTKGYIIPTNGVQTIQPTAANFNWKNIPNFSATITNYYVFK